MCSDIICQVPPCTDPSILLRVCHRIIQVLAFPSLLNYAFSNTEMYRLVQTVVKPSYLLCLHGKLLAAPIPPPMIAAPSKDVSYNRINLSIPI
jgi:hypothetical protein